jgi:hypothetical protein
MKTKKETKIIVILGFILIITWLFFDFSLLKDEIFNKAYGISFNNKTEKDIKEKLKSEKEIYQKAEKEEEQILSMVNMIICNFHLVFYKSISLGKFYDFTKIILFPSLRNQLRNKKNYVNEMKRYFKRMRNLVKSMIRCEVSTPKYIHRNNYRVAEVLVIMTTDKGAFFKQFHFRKHNDNRFYLYFLKESRHLKLRLREYKKKQNFLQEPALVELNKREKQ